jgi:predicted GIY-YIG superfamily endonuclease
MSLSIYILRLQGGKYYVGKTTNVIKRYQEHVNGQGAQWTRIYKPISLEQTIPNASPFDEDKTVKEYMAKYGIENVRGGSYVQEDLSEFHMEALKMELWSAGDKCTQCGRKGHFVKDCYAKTDVTNKKLEYEDSDDDEDSDEYDTWECDYCDRTFTTKFGCNVHENSCKEKNTNVVRSIKKEITSNLPFSPCIVKNTEMEVKSIQKQIYKKAETEIKYVKKEICKKSPSCFRCGREGHYVPDCYAGTHVKGYRLD